MVQHAQERGPVRPSPDQSVALKPTMRSHSDQDPMLVQVLQHGRRRTQLGEFGEDHLHHATRLLVRFQLQTPLARTHIADRRMAEQFSAASFVPLSRRQAPLQHV